MKATRGFTLIEMLTVVVIVGIILAIGIPMMNSMNRATALQGAIREVSNTLQLARQFAITHRTKTEVRVDDTTWNAISVFTNTNYQIDKWKRLPVGVVFAQSSATSVIFKPTGDASASATFVVREGLYDTNTTSWVGLNTNIKTVEVSQVLGRVTIP